MFALSPVNFTPIAFPIPQTSSTAISSLPYKTTQLRQYVFSDSLEVTDELESIPFVTFNLLLIEPPQRLRTCFFKMQKIRFSLLSKGKGIRFDLVSLRNSLAFNSSSL